MPNTTENVRHADQTDAYGKNRDAAHSPPVVRRWSNPQVHGSPAALRRAASWSPSTPTSTIAASFAHFQRCCPYVLNPSSNRATVASAWRGQWRTLFRLFQSSSRIRHPHASLIPRLPHATNVTDWLQKKRGRSLQASWLAVPHSHARFLFDLSDVQYANSTMGPLALPLRASLAA